MQNDNIGISNRNIKLLKPLIVYLVLWFTSTHFTFMNNLVNGQERTLVEDDLNIYISKPIWRLGPVPLKVTSVWAMHDCCRYCYRRVRRHDVKRPVSMFEHRRRCHVDSIVQSKHYDRQTWRDGHKTFMGWRLNSCLFVIPVLVKNMSKLHFSVDEASEKHFVFTVRWDKWFILSTFQCYGY